MINEEYTNFLKFFKAKHDESFVLEPGVGKVLVCAPHSVTHVREGKTLFSEPHSGALARLLHKYLNCPVIYKTKNCNDDANYDVPSPFKDELCNYVKNNGIQCVIDLHQLSPHRAPYVEIGTNGGANLIDSAHYDIIVSALTNNLAYPIYTDKLFKASRPYTIGNYVHSTCNVSCIQIEIQSNLLSLDSAICSVEQIFEALKFAIDKINSF